MSLYHLVFLLVFVGWAPVLGWRLLRDPRYRRGTRERRGWLPVRRSQRPVVWIHGVSVGEVKASTTLVRSLRESRPDVDLVISATTPHGHDQARKLYRDLPVVYYPLDFGWFPGRALDRVRPDCVLLMELEIWPNFLQAAARRGIPVCIINGRMSARSFRGYRLCRGFLPQFNLIDTLCVQDDSYRRRLLALDVDASRIFVTGNVKYDTVMLRDPTVESVRLRRWLSADGRLVLVCGSTHGDEELQLARLVRSLAPRVGPVRVVLAPRHPERSTAIRDQLVADGMTCRMWSRASPGMARLAADEIVLVDAIGQLEMFYGACDVAFVGGSLVTHGGQNMLEPAALGKAVAFGPHVDNFRTDVRLLLEADAAIQASGIDDLRDKLAALLSDAALREGLGERAVRVIRRNQGATERTMSRLAPILDGLRRGSEDHEQEADQEDAQESEDQRRPVQGEGL